MFFKRSLLALTVGFGLSLTACAGEQDIDLGDDFDADAVEMDTMDGGNGVNGSQPGGECLKGVVKAMTTYQGWDPNAATVGVYTANGILYKRPYNPALNNVRCDGTIESSGTKPKVINKVDALKAMSWIGDWNNHGVTSSSGTTYWGNSWFAQNWATSPLSADKADLIGALYMAKWNQTNSGVPIYLSVAPGTLDGANVSPGPVPSGYIEESMVAYVANPLSSYVSTPVALYFMSKEVADLCYYDLFYYDQRTYHNGTGVVTVRPESDVPSYCTKVNQSGQTVAATNIADATHCLGARVVKVYVPASSVSFDPVCEPVN